MSGFACSPLYYNYTNERSSILKEKDFYIIRFKNLQRANFWMDKFYQKFKDEIISFDKDGRLIQLPDSIYYFGIETDIAGSDIPQKPLPKDGSPSPIISSENQMPGDQPSTLFLDASVARKSLIMQKHACQRIYEYDEDAIYIILDDPERQRYHYEESEG